ncbi:hypothetical protein ACROAE_04650 [Shewanella sp. MF05960]|uniref:hypothetical protein n=1 Tax=Shewanella sp. MF05960 TaxID=3434874 RepID=UPI003D794FF2
MEDSKIMIKKEKDQMQSWLTILSWLAIAGLTFFVVIIIMYYKYSGEITSSRDDWATFGSVLAGASSLLAAIGTVGVMLMGIQQFKVQQEQIVEQNKRQIAFERKQQKKWDNENEMLNFQKYLSHVKLFEDTLEAIEARFEIQFLDKNYLYRNNFEKNSINNTTLSFNEGNDTANSLSWMITLDRTLSTLYQNSEIYNKEPTAQTFSFIVNQIDELRAHLNFKFVKQSEHLIKLKDVHHISNLATDTLLKLASFSDYKTIVRLKESATLQVLQSDITEVFGYTNSDNFINHQSFLNCLVHISAAIKNNPTNYPELIKIIQKKYSVVYLKAFGTSESLSLDYIRKKIHEAGLNLNEFTILIQIVNDINSTNLKL